MSEVDNVLVSGSKSWGGIYAALARESTELPDMEQAKFRQLQVDVHGEWPRRLLHVPSMTSVERTSGNMYGTDHEPAYNILSYKWAVWVVESGPTLEVNGINWQIPAVDPARWSVAELQKVIQEITEDVSYVWIDIACVDQGHSPITFDEIKKEPGIFKTPVKPSYGWWTFQPLT